MDLAEELSRRRAWVEAYLDEVLARRYDPLVGELQEAIAYALEGGKRVRALLVMEGAELAGADPKSVLPTAAAVECFHAYSLVHDDLPAMDDDAERRGRPTVHVQFGEAIAILVGDTLLPLGFELISDEQAEISGPERTLPVLQLFARVLGERGLTGGQYLDLSGVDADGWQEVHARKTAALLRASLEAGARLGGMPVLELEKLREFGERLGRTYQLVDDLLDWGEGGKADVSRFVSQEAAQRLIQEQTDLALSGLEPFGERARRLREFTIRLAQRAK